MKRELAPRARFELATLRLTAEAVKNLSALSGVAYEIYLQRGAQPGYEVEDWHQAERELTT